MPARITPVAALVLVAAAVPLASGLLGLTGCGSRAGDPPSSGVTPNPLGSGLRIRDVADPTRSDHPANNAHVVVTGASYLWVDTFDETHDGKSKGTVFMQDVGSNLPYSGMSVYSPTFNPANLKPSPGDVLDLDGTYQENDHIGSAIFTAPDVLPQLSKPIVTPRFEYVAPSPTTIDPNDLNDYAKGRQWMWMLVTLQNVTFPDGLVDDGNGRDTVHVSSSAAKNMVTMSNELFDLAAWNAANGTPIAKGQTVKSITGVVTWFYSYHVAPRSPADIVVQ
jgi:hypothetical protein